MTDREVPFVRFSLRSGDSRKDSDSSLQVLDKEFHRAPEGIGMSQGAVSNAGHGEHFERLVGADQRVDDLHGAGGVDIGVDFA